MPKLPGYEDVGREPSARSGRQRLTARDVDTSAIGRGQMAIGEAITGTAKKAGIAKELAAFGADQERKAKEEQRKKDSIEVLEADARRKALLAEHEQTYDNDPDHANYGKTYDTASKAILKDTSKLISDPHLRKKFIVQSESDNAIRRARILKKAQGVQNEEWKSKVREQVEATAQRYTHPNATDDDRAQAQRDLDAHITLAERNGIITPQAAKEMRNTYARKLALAATTNRLAKDPATVQKELNEFSKLKDASVSDGPPINAGQVKIASNGKVEMSGLPIDVRVNTKAPYMRRTRKMERISEIMTHRVPMTETKDLDWYVQYGHQVDQARGFDPGYHFYVGPDGKVVQGAPLNKVVNGALKRNAQQVHIGFIGEETPEQRRVGRALISGLGTQLGVKHTSVIGHGEAQPGRRDLKDGAIMARLIRDKGYVNGTPVAEESQAEDNRTQELKERYQHLSPSDIVKLEDAARRRVKIDLEGRRQDLKNQIASDIKSRRGTGVGVDVDLETAKKVLTPNQIRRYKDDVKKADAFWKNTRDLSDLTGDEMQQRLADLTPKAGASDYAIKADIQKDVEKAFKDEIELRTKDPARAADKSSGVAAYLERSQGQGTAVNALTGEQMDVSAMTGETQGAGLVDARLQAQTDMDIPDAQQRTITREEARALIPPLNDLDYTSARDELRKAAGRIEGEYGPYAERVLRDALRFNRADKEVNEAAVGVLKKLATGERITQRDLRRLDDYEGIEMSDMFMSVSTDQVNTLTPTTMNPGQPALSGMNAAETEQVAEQQSLEARRQPVRAQVEWAMQDPERRQPVFDQMFGPGAYAQAIEYMQQNFEQ